MLWMFLLITRVVCVCNPIYLNNWQEILKAKIVRSIASKIGCITLDIHSPCYILLEVDLIINTAVRGIGKYKSFNCSIYKLNNNVCAIIHHTLMAQFLKSKSFFLTKKEKFLYCQNNTALLHFIVSFYVLNSDLLNSTRKHLAAKALIFCSDVFFSFLSFFAFQGCTCGMQKFPGQGLNQNYSCWPMQQPQQCGIQALSLTYTAADGNAGSLTHWFEPASS